MSVVALAKGNAYGATKKALELTNFKNFIRGKKKIVIKPNLVIPVHSSKGITTDVNVVKAIIDYLPDPTKAAVVEGATNTSETFKLNGYDKLSKECGIEVIDLNEENEWEEVKVKNPTVIKELKIAKRVVESDFLISVAKLKIHSIVAVTGAMKNMMGVCSKDQRLKIHSYIPNSLMDLLSVKTPDFSVTDGIIANEIDENVPHPVEMGLVLASRDCVALDKTAAEVMGVNPSDVLYLKMAFERGFGNLESTIVGESVGDVKRSFRRANFNLRSDGQRIVGRMIIEIGAFEWFYKNIFPFLTKINKKRKIF